MSEKNLGYYMNLPYKIEITPEPDGTGFNVAIPDLKGCMAFGETIKDALETITEIKQTWFEMALERGWYIPEPAPLEFRKYSGKFNVRLPCYLHRKLAEMAEREDTSLNQIVVALLAEGAELQRQKLWAAQRERELQPYKDWLLGIPQVLKAYVDAGVVSYFQEREGRFIGVSKAESIRRVPSPEHEYVYRQWRKTCYGPRAGGSANQRCSNRLSCL